jgi:transcriptional regulator
MDVEAVLSEFCGTRKKAISEYRRFIRQGINEGRNPELSGGGLIRSCGGWSQVLSMRHRGQKEEYDARILGSGQFVASIFQEAEERQLRQMKQRRTGVTIQKIIDEERKARQISEDELKAGSTRRPISAARAVIAYRCREELGASCAEIARQLGVNTSCVTRAIERVRREAVKKHNGK